MFIGLKPSQFVSYFLNNNTNADAQQQKTRKETMVGTSSHQEVFHKKKKLILKLISVPCLWSKFSKNRASLEKYF